MLVCPDCEGFGEEIEYRAPQRSSQQPSNKYKPRGNYQKPLSTSEDRNMNSKTYSPRKRFYSQQGNEKRKARIENLDLKSDYRKELVKLRRNRNLTQAEFANSVGISETSYKNVEAKKLDLTIPEAQRIETKYKITLTEEASEEDDIKFDSLNNSSGEFTLGDVFFKRKKK